MINNSYFYWIANKNFINSILFLHQMGTWCIDMSGLIICQLKQLTKRGLSVTEEGSPRTSGRRTWSNMSLLFFSQNVFCMLKLYLNVQLNIPSIYDMLYWHHRHYLLLYHADSWVSGSQEMKHGCMDLLFKSIQSGIQYWYQLIRSSSHQHSSSSKMYWMGMTSELDWPTQTGKIINNLVNNWMSNKDALHRVCHIFHV